jgi:hypothetical protein
MKTHIYLLSYLSLMIRNKIYHLSNLLFKMKPLFNHLNSKKKPMKQNLNSQLNLKYPFTKSSAVHGKPSPQKSKNQNLSKPNRPNSNQWNQDSAPPQQQALSQKKQSSFRSQSQKSKRQLSSQNKSSLNRLLYTETGFPYCL